MPATTRNTLLLLAGAALMLPVAASATRSPADQRLYEKARKTCSGPQYTNGAVLYINYKGGWFRCNDYRSRGSGNRR